MIGATLVPPQREPERAGRAVVVAELQLVSRSPRRRQRVTIGDQRFEAVHAKQLNHQLAQFLIELPSVSAYYDSLFAILTQRYGSPTSVTGGFNPTATWSGTHVSIRLQYRSHEYSSDHGWLIYWTPRWDRYTRQQTQDAIKKGVQDLK